MRIELSLARRAAALASAAATLILVTACGGGPSKDGPTRPGGTLATLAITPTNASLAIGQTAEFAAVAIPSTGDSSTADPVSWTVTGGSVVDTLTRGGARL